MGIARQTADVIVRAHKNSPVTGRLLVCGRQSVFLTPDETVQILASYGIAPAISVEECEIDRETRIGGEGNPLRDGAFISDRSFFKMLGVEDIRFLDHTAYEGADIIVDLNNPAPAELEGQFDFIIDGGTLDNVFNPAQALMNIARMLRPGGRMLSYNFYANWGSTYVCLPHQWYLDYFTINRFAFAQTYIEVYDAVDGTYSAYQANHRKRLVSRAPLGNFPTMDAANPIGIIGYAIKASDSTWALQPSQDCYRDSAEWGAMEPIVKRFTQHELAVPLVCSTAIRPIILPGGDDFEYLDVEGNAVTQQTVMTNETRQRNQVRAAIRWMDEQYPDTPWGIVELEKLFYEVINDDQSICRIIEKPNVVLFDVRMLNTSIVPAGQSIEIYPAEGALAVAIPLLILSVTPDMDILWKRLALLFRRPDLFAALHTQFGTPESYLSLAAGIYLSPTFINGSYNKHNLRLPAIVCNKSPIGYALRRVTQRAISFLRHTRRRLLAAW